MINNFYKRNSQKRYRLIVSKSLKNISCQIIDDQKGHTLVSSSSLKIKPKTKTPSSKVAEMVGTDIAQKAKAKKIDKVYFDRNHYKYHGRIKILADSARKAGLDF